MMEANINIAELLKDCPKGMELDCLLYDNVTFERFDVEQNRCYFKAGPADTFWTTCYGKINGSPFGKCVIYPKGKTTWEGFQRPFKNGDILISGEGNPFIFKQLNSFGNAGCYCAINRYGELFFNSDNWTSTKGCRFANEEEKAKLFQAIKDSGYKWNPETNNLDKLPKFKVGDRVKKKDSNEDVVLIADIADNYYIVETKYGMEVIISISTQNDYELVPNKFDISSLKPFDKVLVRDNNEQFWTCDWFSFHDTRQVYPFACVGHYVSQCIPFVGNEHLLGTTNDCDEYFKTW